MDSELVNDSSPASPWATTGVDDHFASQASSWTSKYRHSPNFRARLRFVGQAIAHSLEGAPDARVLDFGGGTGVFAAVASTKASVTVSVDRSLPMLRAGVKDVEGMKEILAGAGFGAPKEPFRLVGDEAIAAALRGEFDLIIAVAVLEYVADCEQLLALFASKLRSGGRVLATVPNHRSLLRLATRAFLPAFRRLQPGTAAFRGQSYQLVRPSGDRVPWRQAAASAGLTVVASRPVPFAEEGMQSLLHPNLLIEMEKP